jgi:glucuronate isomerase
MGLMILHPDRLFPSDRDQRAIAGRLYATVREFPIVSLHGHTDPSWFSDNRPFPDPASLLIIPDHYIYRMLYSQGIGLEELGIPRLDGSAVETDTRKIWRLFAQYWYLFRGTPTRIWFQQVLHDVFGIRETLTPESSDRIYDHLAECLALPEFLPRALFERFHIEVLATTESPLDLLPHHRALRTSGWNGRVIPTFRPDPVTDPEALHFRDDLRRLGEITRENTETWSGRVRPRDGLCRFCRQEKVALEIGYRRFSRRSHSWISWVSSFAGGC